MSDSFDPDSADLGLAALVAGWTLADELQRRVAAAGFDDLRFADGLLFQHLVDGPMPISTLAERLEVTQQAASKSVADLARRGYVDRVEAADRRRHLVTLSAHGRDAIAASREHRKAIEAEISKKLGPQRLTAARKLLLEVIAAGPRESSLRARRLRPPT